MAEINKNGILFKLKGVRVGSFCQRRVSAQEDPEKEDVFGYLTTNSLRKVSVKQNDLWRLVKAIR